VLEISERSESEIWERSELESESVFNSDSASLLSNTSLNAFEKTRVWDRIIITINHP